MKKERNKLEYTADPVRWEQARDANQKGIGIPSTGIFVRAQAPGGECVSVDILLLDRGSLLRFLTKDGGTNKTAEDVCGILCGHGRLHDYG